MKRLSLSIFVLMAVPIVAHALTCVDNTESEADLPNDNIGTIVRLNDITYAVQSSKISASGKTEQVDLGAVATHGATSLVLTCQLPESGIKPFYTCQYDGAHDSYTWQLAGEDIPPQGAAQCLNVEAPYCNKVVSSDGSILGSGIWCGDENGDSPLLAIKAYVQ